MGKNIEGFHGVDKIKMAFLRNLKHLMQSQVQVPRQSQLFPLYFIAVTLTADQIWGDNNLMGGQSCYIAVINYKKELVPKHSQISQPMRMRE